MELRELKHRNKYLLQIRESIMEHVYAEQVKTRAEQIESLVVRNAQLLGINSLCFMYKGTSYHTWSYTPGPGSNRLIHEDLLSEVIETIDGQDFDTFVEENQVMNYINDVLSAARHIDDLWALLPDRVARPIRSVNHEAINMGAPMSQAELDEFKTAHQEDFRAFKRLFFERLLMS